MVEQLICNQQVAGSIPIASSSNVCDLMVLFIVGSLTEALNCCGEVPERSKGADCKSAGAAFGGSNPPLSTTSKHTFSRR